MSEKSVKRKISFFEIIISAVMSAVFILSLHFIVHNTVTSDAKTAISLYIYMIVLIFAMILYIGCAMGHNEDLRSKRLFELMIVLSYFSTFFGLAVNFFNGNVSMRYITLTAQMLNNSLLAVYWLVFWRYQKRNYERYSLEIIVDWVITVYLSVYIAFSFLNLFIPILFTVNGGGFIQYRTDYFMLTYLSLWYLFYFCYVFTRKIALKVKITLASYVLFPAFLNVVSFILSENDIFRSLYYPFNSLCFLIPLYLIYFNLHIENSKRLLEQREELTAARINLMVSQIQPHFIYNSLTAIIDLIDKDTETAKERIVDFSDYLRVNLDSLKEVRLIPFAKELEHCKTYLNFEQLRFENIKIEYDIKISDFVLPVLTVQPLVENAVKHGLSKTVNGGTITIATQETEKNVIITVKDNGVGFEENEVTDKIHVGLYNVKKRLSDMCDGTLELKSKKGEGTAVTVTLPKERIKQ